MHVLSSLYICLGSAPQKTYAAALQATHTVSGISELRSLKQQLLPFRYGACQTLASAKLAYSYIRALLPVSVSTVRPCIFEYSFGTQSFTGAETAFVIRGLYTAPLERFRARF